MTPENEQTPLLSLKQWVNKVYVRSGMFQLLVIEGLLLCILFGAFFLLNHSHTSEASKDREQQMIQALQARTDWVSSQLLSVKNALHLFQKQAARQLLPNASSDQHSVLKLSNQNVLYKPYDDGGISVYYSTQSAQMAARPVLARQWLPLSPIMVDLKHSHGLIRQIYLNTPDGLNLLYPFVDVTQHFPPDLDLTEFNFFYLAEASHSPNRESVWTDAYLDPAGQGWVISNIAPVYKNDRLEAVVGVDLTVQSLINELFATPQQWPGYGVLVGKNGNILALPPEGEQDFSLKELAGQQYSFQQEQRNQPTPFNLYKRDDFTQLSRLIAHQQAGLAQVQLNQPSVVAWNTIPATGWKLLAVAKAEDLYINARHFSNQIKDIALLVSVLAGIILLLYFFFHTTRTRRLSRHMLGPLDYFQDVIRNSGKIDTSRTLNSPVLEIHQTAELIKALVQQSNGLSDELEEHKQQHQQQNIYFQKLLNSIPIPIFDTDAELRLRGCNRAFEQFFGRSESELSGHLITEFIPVAAPKQGMSQQRLTISNAAGIGRHMTVLLSRGIENEKNQRQLPLIGLLVDISEQHHEQDQIRFDRDRALEASQLQSEYLQAIRREIEVPLQGLKELIGQLGSSPKEVYILQQQLMEKVQALSYLAKDGWLIHKESDLGSGTTPGMDVSGSKTTVVGPANFATASRQVQHGCHVLVVDDGPVNTMLARSVLQKAGYDVDVAFSGMEALDKQREKSYQVVLMDIFMPDMDGIETTKRWREREKEQQQPSAAIIALTANVIESEREHFFAAGMNEYLAKPYHPSELRDRVDYWRQQYETGPIEV